MAGRAVVLVLGLQLLEELGDVHAGAIREVPGFVLVLGIVTTDIADDERPKGFEVAATELHGTIVASGTDKRPDSVGCGCTVCPGMRCRIG